MKTLVAGLVLFSIPVVRPTPSPRKPVETTSIVARTNRGGRWYLAANGHAVYCRGPVITINMADGLRKVATYCQGEKPLVPLKE